MPRLWVLHHFHGSACRFRGEAEENGVVTSTVRSSFQKATMKYRRKPIVVDAEQFINDVDQKHARKLGLLWRECRGRMNAGGWYSSDGQRVAEGMWLVQGNFWMTDDDFKKQYDPA